MATLATLATLSALATLSSALLGETNRVGATLQGAAADLANTLDEIGATLDCLAKKTNERCHYTMDVDYCWRFYRFSRSRVRFVTAKKIAVRIPVTRVKPIVSRTVKRIRRITM